MRPRRCWLPPVSLPVACLADDGRASDMSCRHGRHAPITSSLPDSAHLEFGIRKQFLRVLTLSGFFWCCGVLKGRRRERFPLHTLWKRTSGLNSSGVHIGVTCLYQSTRRRS
ncbi:hypothetical protein B0T09DRAFT_98539 [Sordaria sp. MPI-SDFR-AT-0083]|nr:hypothetical protein B0T09DRAFT_98539 [Sordaria sp. MPI-SDFR-AT-0083]